MTCDGRRHGYVGTYNDSIGLGTYLIPRYSILHIGNPIPHTNIVPTTGK